MDVKEEYGLSANTGCWATSIDDQVDLPKQALLCFSLVLLAFSTGVVALFACLHAVLLASLLCVACMLDCLQCLHDCMLMLVPVASTPVDGTAVAGCIILEISSRARATGWELGGYPAFSTGVRPLLIARAALNQ